MTDATVTPTPAMRAKGKSLFAEDARTKKRNAAEFRFRMYGIIAITIGLAFLVFLFVSILRNGIPAFTQTAVQVEITLTQEEFDAAESELLKTAAYTAIFVEKMTGQLEESGLDVEVDGAAIERLLGKVGSDLREFYREDESRIGQPVQFQLAAASRVERYLQGKLTR